jgi:predicted anti-sigma-YlaC factor YlaD
MICCKECLDLLADYLDGELDSNTAQSLEEHFQDCPPCIAFLNTYKSTTKIWRDTLGTIEIPDVVKSKLQAFLKETTRKES